MAFYLEHDRDLCAWCVARRAEELMLPGRAPSMVALAMAARWHPGRRELDLTTGRVSVHLDPDADRETLFGEPG